MNDRDWARGAAWDDATRATFDAKIKRARDGWTRFQYFHGKAFALCHADDDEIIRAGIELHRRALVEVKKLEPSWRVGLLHGIARGHVRLDEDAAAEPLLREAASIVPPAERTVRFGETSPEADLAALLLRAGKDAESDAIWKKSSVDDDRRPSTVAELGPSIPLSVGGEAYRSIDDAAEHFVAAQHIVRDLTELFDADRKALVALDAHVRRHQPLCVYRDARFARAVFELGAFLVRCAVRAGVRVDADETPRWSVTVNGRDPFDRAWRVIVRGLPAARALDELVSPVTRT